MREYLIRVRQRETDDLFIATVRQVAPGAILDAPAAPNTTDTTQEAHTAAGAIVGAVLGSRILDVTIPADHALPLPPLRPTHGGYPTVEPPVEKWDA